MTATDFRIFKMYKNCRYFSFLKLNRIIKRMCSTSTENVRVRFAPSPTGFLHLGGMRTALYNYLYARSKNGTFILRIEDTDRSRIIENAVEKLEYDLQWIGIIPDESPSKGGPVGPYFQSERISLYQEAVKQLIQNGTAYYCFCTEERLDILRRDLLKRDEVPKYDNKCRCLTQVEITQKLDSGIGHCVRFKLSPIPEPFKDLVYGEITHNVALIEGDPVILKSDGFPTYHLANVVDDHYMKISHVLRGQEWQLSTTKHLLLYKAFGWKPPKYAHLPLILNEDKTKLSKRQGDITIEHYREKGVLPIALVNFLVTCGGGFSKESYTGIERNTCRDFDYLYRTFDLRYVLTNSGSIKHDLLPLLNRDAMKKSICNPQQLSQLIKHVRRIVEDKFTDRPSTAMEIALKIEVKYPARLQSSKPHMDAPMTVYICHLPRKENVSLFLTDDHIEKILRWSAERINTLSDLVSKEYLFLWVLPSLQDLLNYERVLFDKAELLATELKSHDDFKRSVIVPYLREFCSRNSLDFARFMKFLRVCLSGLKKGPSIGEMMAVLDKDDTLSRLHKAIKLCESINTDKSKIENSKSI